MGRIMPTGGGQTLDTTRWPTYIACLLARPLAYLLACVLARSLARPLACLLRARLLACLPAYLPACLLVVGTTFIILRLLAMRRVRQKRGVTEVAEKLQHGINVIAVSLICCPIKNTSCHFGTFMCHNGSAKCPLQQPARN